MALAITGVNIHRSESIKLLVGSTSRYDTHWLSIIVEGSDNSRFESTVFIEKKDVPLFEKACKAFNDALTEQEKIEQEIAVQSTKDHHDLGEERVTNLDDEIPF